MPKIDTARVPLAVQLTRKAGTAVVPNLSFVAMTRRQLDEFDKILAQPEARYLTEDVLAMWRAGGTQGSLELLQC